MPRPTNMGNCSSKRQESADCENLENIADQQKQQISQNGANLNRDEIVREQVSSKQAKPTLAGKYKSPNKPSQSKEHKQKPQQPTRGNTSDSKTANNAVIDSTRAQVNSLLEGIHNFQGTSQNDKDYRYLDEMLTRCMLKLDTIECNDSNDRTSRKEAIKGVNEAISILERKLEINTEIKELESNLRTDQ